MRKWCFGLMLLALSFSAHAAVANPGGSGYLDAIATTFQSGMTGWMTTAQGYAKHIFASLAALDLAWWGIKNVLKKNDLADFIGGATLKISSIFFFYTIVSYAPTWMPLITSSFMQMGQGIGGTSVATPSGVMSEAFSVISSLWNVVNSQPSGLTHISANITIGLIVVATSIFGLIGFGLVALQLLMTLIEMYLVGGAGLVMLGFTGSGLTSNFGEKYIGYLISVGIKLLVIYAIVGLGQNLINSENQYIQNWQSQNLPPLDLLTVGASMLIYGVLGMQVPGLAGSLMNGSPNMSLGNVAGGAAAIAGGAMAAGGVALAGYAGSMKSLDKMAEMVGAGAGGAGAAAGGIGGSENLAALSSMTGSSSTVAGSSAGIGEGAATSLATDGGSAMSGGDAEALSLPSESTSSVDTSPAVPANSSTDALGAGRQPGSGMSDTGSGVSASDDKNSSWKAMGDQFGKLARTKDEIARHEGGTGGGIQIRLNHVD